MLKKEAFRAWLSWGSVEAASNYRLAKKAAAKAVMEAKTLVWEEFGEAMEKDFRLIVELQLQLQLLCGFRPGRRTVDQLFTF